MTKFRNMALLAALVIAPSTMAAASEPGGSANVYYGDLDLTSNSGQKALDHRLEWAARHVCSYENGLRAVACRRKALAGVEVKREQAVAAAITSKQQLASR